jgi:hypothetical protein
VLIHILYLFALHINSKISLHHQLCSPYRGHSSEQI